MAWEPFGKIKNKSYQVIQCDLFIPQLEVTNNHLKGSRFHYLKKKHDRRITYLVFDPFFSPQTPTSSFIPPPQASFQMPPGTPRPFGDLKQPFPIRKDWVKIIIPTCGPIFRVPGIPPTSTIKASKLHRHLQID